MKPVFFITGTDTGVGKTVLTALLARFLRKSGLNAVALKPVCSGGRADAQALHDALTGALSLDEINPWHFRPPIAPLLAARRDRKRVRLNDVLTHVRAMQKRFDVVLIEGAGGLLSPLGDCFNSRDIITALRATPIVVCPNRLGSVNQVLLTLEALPKSFRRRARVVLMSPPQPDISTRTNAGLLVEWLGAKMVFPFPCLGRHPDLARVSGNPQVQRTLRALTQA